MALMDMVVDQELTRGRWTQLPFDADAPTRAFFIMSVSCLWPSSETAWAGGGPRVSIA